MFLPLKSPCKALVAFVLLGLAGCAVTPAPSPDAPATEAENIGMIDFTSFEQRHQWPTNSSTRDLAVDPAGRYALVSFVNAPGSELTYLDLESGASRQLVLEQPAPNSQSAYAIAIDPRGERFAAGWVGNGAIYDRDDLTIIHEIDHSYDQSRVNYNDLVFTPDGQGLVAAFRDVVLWNVASGEKLHVIEDIEGPQKIASARDGILGVISYQRVVLKNPGSRENVCEFEGGASAIDFSPDGRHAAFSVSGDNTVRVLRISDCGEIAQLSFGATFIPVIAWMPDNRHLATGSDDGRVRIWDALAGELVHSLQAHDGGVAGMALSGDGQVMITTSWGNAAVKSWEAQRL